MAFAIASGAKPEQGIYTAIVAGGLTSLLGGSRLQIAGPTGAFIVILSGITAEYGIQGLQLATLMAGVILVLMGFTKLGGVIKFIPDPVIVGFTSGIAVIIWVGQWKDFFWTGTQLPTRFIFTKNYGTLIQAFPNAHLETTILSVTTLGIVILSPYVIKRIPAPLVAMVAATLIQWNFSFSARCYYWQCLRWNPSNITPISNTSNQPIRNAPANWPSVYHRSTRCDRIIVISRRCRRHGRN